MLDLIIIGAGPAGLSACLYASRAGLDVLIFDSAAPGGKLNVTAQIENLNQHQAQKLLLQCMKVP